MQRRTLLRALGGLAAGGAVAQPTAAQEESPQSETPTATSTPTTTSSRSDGSGGGGGGDRPVEPAAPTPEKTKLAALDPTTDLLDYEVSDVTEDDTATFTVWLETRVPTMVTMADPFAGLASEGVTTVPVRKTSVPKGKRVKVSMETTVWREDSTALSLATARGDPVVISTGLPEKGEPQTGLWTGVSAGVITMGLGTGLAAWRKVANQDESPEDGLKNDGGLFR